MSSFVKSNSLCKCSVGTIPQVIMVDNKVQISGVGIICKKDIVKVPFGLCLNQLSPQGNPLPCNLKIIGEWDKIENRINIEPITSESKLKCTFGGIIELVNINEHVGN